MGLSAETQTLTTQLDLKDGLTGGLARATQGVKNFAGISNKSFKDVGTGAKQFAGGLVRVGAMAGGLAVGGIAAAAKATANFTDEMNIINTIAGVTPDKLQKIGHGIQDLSADTGAGLSDLTASYYDLLSAGIKLEDAQGMLEVSYKLGRGSLATTSEAVDFLTTAINSYSLSGKDATKVGDYFAKAVEVGKVKLSEISATFADVAPIASQYGIGLDEIAASYGHLTSKGNTAGSVTTQMARAITELAKPGGPLLELEAKSKKSYIAIAGEKGLVAALQEMRDDAKRLGFSYIDLFGRQEAYKYAVQTTGKNLKDYNGVQKEVIASGGTLEKQYGARNQGLNFQFTRLAANVKIAGLAIGEGFAPALGRAADKLVAFIKDNKDELRALGKDIGKWLDSVDFKALLDGAKQFGGLLGDALQILKLIPTEVAITAAGLLGINKLSGGLLGEGLKNMVGGMLGGLTRGVMSKVPGMGGLDKLTAQPVRVVNWNEAGMLGGGAGGAAAGGLGGKLMSGLKIAGAVTIAGVSIAALAEQFGIFQQTTAQAQASLDAKVADVKNHTQEASLLELKSLNENLSGLNIWDRALADSFGGKQIADALLEQSHNIADGKDLSSAQITDAIITLEESQKHALARGNTKVADAIGLDIEKLRRQQQTSVTRTTTALAGIKGQIAEGDERIIAPLQTIAAQPTNVNITVPVTTSVSVRDVTVRENTTSRYGFVAK